MSEQWKYSRDGQLKAGVSREEIARMVAAGELGDDDSVFSSSLKTWQPVRAVREMLLQAQEPAETAAAVGGGAAVVSMPAVEPQRQVGPLRPVLAQSSKGPTKPLATERWRYSHDGKFGGPLSRAVLGELIASGKLSADDQVCSTRQGVWAPVRSLPPAALEPSESMAELTQADEVGPEVVEEPTAQPGNDFEQDNIQTATEAADFVDTAEPAGRRGERNVRRAMGKSKSNRLDEMMMAYGPPSRAGKVPLSSPPQGKAAIAGKWAITAVVAVVAVILLIIAVWPRDSWERQHKTEVVSLFEEGEDFYSSRHYVEAVEKYARLGEMMGERSLADERLKKIAKMLPGRLESARSAARRSEQIADQRRMPEQPTPQAAYNRPPSATASPAVPVVNGGSPARQPGAVTPGFRRTVFPDGSVVVVPIPAGETRTRVSRPATPPVPMNGSGGAQPGTTDAGQGLPLAQPTPAPAPAVSEEATTPAPGAMPVVTALPEGMFWTMVVPLGKGLSVTHEGLAQVQGVRVGKNAQSLKLVVTANGPQFDMDVLGMDPTTMTLSKLGKFSINSSLRHVYVDKVEASLDEVNVELLGSGERVIGQLKLATSKSNPRVKAYLNTERALETATAKTAALSQALQQAVAAYNTRRQRADSSYLRQSEQTSLNEERDRIAQTQAQLRSLGVQCQQLTAAFQQCRDACIRMVDAQGLLAVERRDALKRQREEMSAKLPGVKRKFDEADIKSQNMPDATVRAQWLDRAVAARDELSAFRQQLSTVEAELSILEAKLETAR